MHNETTYGRLRNLLRMTEKQQFLEASEMA